MQLFLDAYKHMKSDGMVLGEKDLSMGLDLIYENVPKSGLTVFSTDIINSKTNKPIFTPFKIFKLNGLKVLVLGISGKLASSTLGEKYSLKNSEASIMPIIKQHRNNVDIIVLLSHLGIKHDTELTESIKGIDIILSSHDGRLFFEPKIINSTIIFQSGKAGKYIGRLDMVFRKKGLEFFGGVEWNRIIIKEEKLKKELEELKKAKYMKTKVKSEKIALNKELEKIAQKKEEINKKNFFRYKLIQLNRKVKDDMKILTMIETYLDESVNYMEEEPMSNSCGF